MKKKFALCIATLVFLTVLPSELLAHHSGDPKLDRAVEKANSEFIVAMKTSDAATIAAPYTDDASFITIDGAKTHTLEISVASIERHTTPLCLNSRFIAAASED